MSTKRQAKVNGPPANKMFQGRLDRRRSALPVKAPVHKSKHKKYLHLNPK